MARFWWWWLDAAAPLVLVLGALLACADSQPAAVPGTVGEVLMASEDTIPSQKLLQQSLQLHVAANVDFRWEIEAGKSLDVYIMTEEQAARADAGQVPTELGRDFIRVSRDVVGAGNQPVQLQPGRYVFALQNDGPTDVFVRSSVGGQPL
jgi:hypothetical protein